ncbi:MAG: lanthionine synthetase LanC family protein [Acidobacteriota bacterium]
MTHHLASPPSPTRHPAPDRTVPDLVDAMSRAERCAIELLDASFVDDRGGRLWLDPEAPIDAPRALSPHLYDGTVGIGLFLARAAAESAEHQNRFRAGALSAVAPIRSKLLAWADDPRRKASAGLAIGGFVGLGGFVYAFARMADDLDDAELLDDASRIAELITADRIAADDQLDIMSGVAGALSGLLTLIEIGQGSADWIDRSKLLDRARLCGEHLLDRRASWRDAPRAWFGPEDRPPLSGFAHGASGIGFALLRLVEHTGDERLRAAAFEGFDFERFLFLPEVATWLDPRYGRPLEQTAWCHGAPGVALARARALRWSSAPALSDDLEQALPATEGLPNKAFDHLCCGNAGQIEILALLGDAMARPELIRHAERLAAWVDERGPRFDDDDTPPLDDDASSTPCRPSLLLGRAGWGWAQLRLAHPDTTPSLLTME